jgi:hypothetical protein
MGSYGSGGVNVRRGPHREGLERLHRAQHAKHGDVRQVVAVQVAFERHILKPGFHLIGARVETRRLSATNTYGSGGVNVHRPTKLGLLPPQNASFPTAFCIQSPRSLYSSARSREGRPTQTRTPIGRRRNKATSLVHTYRADQWASVKATRTTLPRPRCRGAS